MGVVDRLESLLGAAVGGGFAGSGCGAVAGYMVVPLAAWSAGGGSPGKSAGPWLFLMCVVGGAVAGAGVGVLVRARSHRRAGLAEPGAAADTGGVTGS